MYVNARWLPASASHIRRLLISSQCTTNDKPATVVVSVLVTGGAVRSCDEAITVRVDVARVLEPESMVGVAVLATVVSMTDAVIGIVACEVGTAVGGNDVGSAVGAASVTV
jgi:hypothetical protein